MRKFFTRIFLPIAAVWAVIRFLLDYWGYMQAIREAFANRGPIVTALAPILSSQWLPVGVFVVAILIWFYIEVGRNWFTPEPELDSGWPKYSQVLRNLAEIKQLKKEGFRIEALPPEPHTTNLSQHVWHEGANIPFVADAVLAVTNPLPAQGIDLVHFRLLSISPPMKSKKGHKPSTLDTQLKRIDFSADIPGTVAGGKTSEVKLFKATRPFVQGTLKDIAIDFYGEWPEGYYSTFYPDERYLLVVEVTAKGVSRMEETFELVFSSDMTKPVFTLTKVRRYDVEGRAEFSPMRAFLEGDEPDEYKFAIGIKNTGDCTATEIHCRGFVWDEHLKGDLRVIGDQLANDVSTGTYVECCFGARLTTRNAPQHFVVLTLEYKPNPQSPATKQTFYFKFRGIKNGKFDRVLVVATKIEKEAIERRFAEELQRAGLKA